MVLLQKVSNLASQAPFTRYRFHFISDWVRQSDMKISPVYTMPFSFHSGLGFCLHDTVSPCTVMVSLYSVIVPVPLRILRSSPNGFEASRIDNEVPYCVDIGFDRLHDIGLVSCHFQSAFI